MEKENERVRVLADSSSSKTMYGQKTLFAWRMQCQLFCGLYAHVTIQYFAASS